MYDALLEALKSGETSYPCSTFRQQYEDLKEVNPETGRVRLEEEFEVSERNDAGWCNDTLKNS